MGLFKSLLNRSEKKSSSHKSNFPDLYTGMKAEVMTPANVLIFVGKLRLMNGGDILEVRAESGGYVPRALYNQPVKLRVFHRDGSSSTLNGNVRGNSFDFWRIEQLAHLQGGGENNREFFRQNTGVEGWVYPITSSKGQRFPCRVLDISGGGARVVTSKLFELGGTFRLEVSVIPDQPPFTVTCQVTRTLVRSRPGSSSRKLEYGWQFVELSPRDEERIMKTVFALQRKILPANREQP